MNRRADRSLGRISNGSRTGRASVVSDRNADAIFEEDEATFLRKRYQDIEERRLKEWENYQRSQRSTIEQTTSKVFLDINIGDVPMGRLIVELFDESVPETAANFRALVTGERMYDENGIKLDYIDAPINRIVNGVGAFGGELANYSIAANGGKMKEENFSGRHSQRGLLSMVSNGPNAIGSHFCITFDKVPDFDFRYVVIGRIVDGLPALEKLESVSTKATGVPRVPVTIAFCGALTGKRPTGAYLSFEDWKRLGTEPEPVDESENLTPHEEEPGKEPEAVKEKEEHDVEEILAATKRPAKEESMALPPEELPPDE